MGIYAGDEGTYVVFDSGCTLAVSPFKSDFQGSITPMNKQMNGLGATSKVTGEGTITWTFRDDYGVEKYIQVK